MRHTMLVTKNDPGRGLSITTHAQEYPRDSQIPLHAHGSDQLVYASRGVMEIGSGQSLWVLPPHFGLWIPAHTEHTVRMSEHVSMRTLYLRSSIYQAWTTCTVFHVTPFLRELVFEIVRIGRIRMRSRLECALRDILVSQLMKASPVPTGVALPRDQRVLPIAEIVLKDPSRWRPLAVLAHQQGVSVRTVQRVFQREVGLDFESWRRQVRLMTAIRLLVSGLSVKEVACAVGYQDSSTFVALFRSTFGRTPRYWISDLNRSNLSAPAEPST